jgi:thiamine pyrophosphokinase
VEILPLPVPPATISTKNKYSHVYFNVSPNTMIRKVQVGNVKYLLQNAQNFSGQSVSLLLKKTQHITYTSLLETMPTAGQFDC